MLLVSFFSMTQPLSFGALLGRVVIAGVSLRVFSNGDRHFVSSQETYDHNGEYLGLRYQCVELVRRYLYRLTGMNGAEHWRGIAGEMYENAKLIGLEQIPFREAKKGDVLCFSGGKWGHVSIIQETNEDSLFLVQQNFFNNERDLSFEISRSAEVVSDGHGYFVPVGCLRASCISENTSKKHDCLSDIRHEIDVIDGNLLELLSRRFLCSCQIANMKKTLCLPVADARREEDLFHGIRKTAKRYGFSPDIAESIFREIVAQSREIQEKNLEEEDHSRS